MIQVVISYPNGQQQEVLLAGVPRVGEFVRLQNGPGSSPSYEVIHVLWVEGKGQAPEPFVTLVVRPKVEGPPG